MATKTAKNNETKNVQVNVEELDFQRATLGELPPLCIPIEDGSVPVLGIVRAVECTEDRRFYRMELLAPAKGTKDKTGEEHEYAAGDVVSLPGSGSLDYQLTVASAKLTGEIPGNATAKEIGDFMEKRDEDQDDELLQALVGVVLKVLRGTDEVMKTGKWKGKSVKKFSVEFAKPKS